MVARLSLLWHDKNFVVSEFQSVGPSVEDQVESHLAINPTVPGEAETGREADYALASIQRMLERGLPSGLICSIWADAETCA